MIFSEKVFAAGDDSPFPGGTGGGSEPSPIPEGPGGPGPGGDEPNPIPGSPFAEI